MADFYFGGFMFSKGFIFQACLGSIENWFDSIRWQNSIWFWWTVLNFTITQLYNNFCDQKNDAIPQKESLCHPQSIIFFTVGQERTDSSGSLGEIFRRESM